MIENIISNSLKNNFTYQQYRNHISEFIKNNQNQQDSIYEFTVLNNKRMERLDKTLTINSETKLILNKINQPITFLVISEGWCGDAAQIVPVFNKISEASNWVDLKIVFRDENEDLMNLFLTNGSKSIPKLILLNSENTVLGTWGPRPTVATNMVLDYKEKNGALDSEFKKQLQLWYNKDKGENVQHEIAKMLSEILISPN